MKKFLVCLPAVLFILLSVCILSCEVGLGESVDTEAPKISITYPDAKSVIKDRFVLAGECSDDRMVSSVQVTILDSSNKPVTGYELKAPVVETGKSSQVWSVEINAKNADGSYPLKDGKYTFRTIATDGAGRKSAPFERDLEIDNTAPVFVINSPGSTETETSYGSVLKVEGSIAEAHSVKSMALTVYNTDGTEKAKWTEENINIAGGTAVTFAKYYSNTGGTDSLLTRYNEIYDTQAGGFQAFKCSVELTDSACVYQKPDFVPSYNRSSVADQPSSSGGNTTSDVWLYDDIYGTDAKYVLMGTKASEVWGKSFEVSDFMNILNGTVPYDTKNADGKTVLEVLNTAKTDTSATSLKLKLNKDANPTYTVMGYSFDSTAENDGVLSLSPAAKGGTITFKADAGLDGVLFSPATIKVYMFGPFEKDAVTSKQLSDIYSDPDSYAAGNAAVTTILYDGKNGVKGGNQEIYGPYTGESRSTWTQSLSLPSDSKIMKATKCYVIAATGEDKDNVEFISENNRYNGFEAQATGVPPSVSITSPGADSISNNPQDILTVKGTIKSDEGTAVNDASYEIYVYDVTNNNTLLGTIKNRDTNSDDNGSMKITGTLGLDPEVSFEIDASKGTWEPEKGVSKDGTKPSEGNVFKYLISVSGVTDITGKDSVTAQVDMLKPTASIEVSTLLSSSDGTRTDCVNGLITVKTSLSDNDKIAQSWIEITDASLSKSVKIDDRSSGVTNYSVQFDTTTINDGDYNVTVYAKDNAGNIGSSSQEICIDQSTDLPVITLSNADEKITEIKDIKVGENLFDQTGNNKLSGAVVDDDGIAEIKIEYKENGSSKAFEKLCTLSAGGKTSYSFSQALKTSAGILKEGFYLIKITATDNAKGKTNTTPEFAICISNNAPSITFINPVKNSESYQNEGFTASGTVLGQFNLSDDNASELILKRGTKAVTVTREGDGYKWNENITSDDISGDSENTGITTNDRVLYTITYTVTDSFGRETTDYVKFRFDNTLPVVEINDYNQPAYIGLTRTTIYSFAGTVDDDNAINSLEYSIDNGSTWTSISAQRSINANIDFKNVDGEEAKVQFRATDEAGNVSEATAKSSRTVKIIKNAPEFGASFTLNVTGGTAKQDGNTYYVNNPFTITGTVTSAALDNVSCGENVFYTNSFTTPQFNASGDYTFTATDKAGQTSSKTVSVVFDAEPPVPEISQVSPLVTGYADTPAEYKNGAVNGIITVQGSSTDNDKVISTVLKVYKEEIKEENVVNKENLITPDSSNTANNYKFTIDTTKFDFDNTGIIVCIVSTDRTGNVATAEYPVYVCQDTDKPIVSSSNMNLKLLTEKDISSEDGKNLFGMGSQTVYVTATDDDGIANFTYKIDASEEKTLYSSGDSSTTSVTRSVLLNATGAHTITFKVVDINGKEYSTDPVWFAVDNDVPVISDIKIGGKTYEKGMFVSKKFAITGKASDESEIASVELAGVFSTQSPSVSGSESWSSSDFEETEGSKEVTVTVKDKYGRSSSTKLEFKVDVTPPVWKESENGDNVPTTISGGQKTKTNDELAAMTERYWFNTNSITLSGKAWDKNEITGYTLKVNDTETTSSGGNGYSILANYKDGLNRVTLKAKDAAGNKSSREISVYVDTVQPELKNTIVTVDGKAGSSLYINAESQVTVTVSAADTTSGVSKILIGMTPSFKDEDAIGTLDISSDDAGINGNDVTETINISEKSHEWADGTQTIYIRAVDKSGLSSIESYISGLIVDKTSPAITYTSHSQGAAVNKTVTVSGTYTEANNTDSLEASLYYRTTSDGAWKKASQTVYVSAEGTWSVDFDTTVLNDKTKYDFQIRMTDKAGNTVPETAALLTLYVNQDSNRPVVKVTFSNTDGIFRLGDTSFTGTVSDDDGVIKSIYLQMVEQGDTLKSDWGTALAENSNEWKYENITDGTYNLYFKVIDKAGGTFITGNNDLLTVPKIQNNNEDVAGDKITLSVDTNPPVVSSVQVNLQSADKGEVDDYEDVNNNHILGGVKYKYATFRVKASDTVSTGDRLTVNVRLGEQEYSALYNNNTGYYETKADIDIGNSAVFVSGIYQFVAEARDEAGKTTSLTRIVTIDNTAPDTIKNVIPSADTEVTGEFEMSGLLQDDEKANSGIPLSDAMAYYIPTNTTHAYTTEEQLKTLAWSNENLTQTAVTWKIDFAGLAEKLGYSKENEMLGNEYLYAQDSSNTDLYDIPVWFRLTDNAGNVGYIQGNTLRFNPNADKPQVQITYPEMIDGEELVMGGTVRIQGSASDNEGVDSVWLQFDFNNDGEYENGNEIENAPKNSEGKVYIGGDSENIAQSIPVKGDNGFKVKGTLSWSSSVDLSGFTAGTKIRMRAVAVDKDTSNPLASAWSKELVITVDNNIPQLEDLKLVQYAEESYTTPKKEISYADDVFISGLNWRLEGRAVHTEGVSNVSVSAGNSITTEADGNNKKFFIPINKDTGSWTAMITAVPSADSPYQNNTTFSVHIDNEAPALETDSNGLIMYKDNYGIEANKLSSSVFVQNSNGEFATIAARVNESGSGFERAVFYFVRTDSAGSNKRVYNVMDEDRNVNRTSVQDSKADGQVYINEDKLAVLYMNNIGRSDLTKLNLTTNNNIRAGGLVKIGGTYHKIIEVTETSVTIDDEVSTTYKEAEFVYGMVVDNSGESRNSSGIKNDDGDGMVESYSKSGSNYTWDASVPSANIPDGPIEIHVVVFDKAGNTNYGRVSTRISNSPIRITSVRLATDLNGNGAFDDAEYQQFYAIKNSEGTGDTSQGVEIWNLDTKQELGREKCWAVKERLSIQPEFVGGTEPFYWTLSKGSEGLSAGESLVKSSAKEINNKTVFSLDNNDLSSGDGYEGAECYYRFSFWDSTEELTPGTDTSWTVLNAYVKQELVDNIAPTVSISPFYWKNSTENSLYKNSTENGHIELEADWQETDAYKNNTGNSVYDGDPKVSGIIKVQGTANDNKILKNIEIKISSFMNEYQSVGTYTRTGDTGWNDTKLENDIAVALENQGWAFTVDRETISQADGHTIEWTLTWDTSKITDTAVTDVKIFVRATDQSEKASSEPDEIQTTAERPTPYYRVDVVPYITELITTLSGIETKNHSVYGRTASGRYPVYFYTQDANGNSNVSEKISVVGFNIAKGSQIIFTENAATATLDSDLSFKLPQNAVSGKIEISVNSIKNLNNINNKNAKGSYEDVASDSLYDNYKNYYNRQPNNVNNDLLEDDVELAIWGINSKSAVSPKGFVSEATMHINPSDGQLGFSFSSGNYGYYPSGVDCNGKPQKTSLEFWCRDYTPVNTMRFVYDNQGHMFGVHAGTDTNNPRVARFRLVSSVWGPSSTIDDNDSDWICAYSANNALRLEYMANYKSSDNSYVMNGTRFQFHPQLAASASGTKTNLYLMYYDSLTNELRFRAGQMDNKTAFVVDTNANGKDANSTQNTASSFGDFYDDAYTDSRTTTQVVTNYNHVSVLASSATNTGNSPYAPGERYAIAVVPGSQASTDTVVAVWCDDIHKTLWYSYLTNPITNNHRNVNSTTHVNKSWSTPVAILDGNSGGYAAIAVDSDKHIHIASYSKERTGSLVYTYLDSYESATPDYIKTHSVFVDSYGSTGQYITIDFAKDSTGTRYIPYIGYLMTSLQYPKYAYLVDVDSAVENSSDWIPKPGTDSENMYTGAWESVILPTENKFLLDDICIGVFRKSDGNLQNIPIKTGNNICGGNGTSNPVIGYGINYDGQGYIETAQLK